MPLVLEMFEGQSFYADDNKVRVEKIVSHKHFVVSTEGQLHDIVDTQSVEVLPGVRVSGGASPMSANAVKILITAPMSVKILREKKYLEQNRKPVGAEPAHEISKWTLRDCVRLGLHTNVEERVLHMAANSVPFQSAVMNRRFEDWTLRVENGRVMRLGKLATSSKAATVKLLCEACEDDGEVCMVCESRGYLVVPRSQVKASDLLYSE